MGGLCYTTQKNHEHIAHVATQTNGMSAITYTLSMKYLMNFESKLIDRNYTLFCIQTTNLCNSSVNVEGHKRTKQKLFCFKKLLMTSISFKNILMEAVAGS